MGVGGDMGAVFGVGVPVQKKRWHFARALRLLRSGLYKAKGWQVLGGVHSQDRPAVLCQATILSYTAHQFQGSMPALLDFFLFMALNVDPSPSEGHVRFLHCRLPA